VPGLDFGWVPVGFDWTLGCLGWTLGGVSVGFDWTRGAAGFDWARVLTTTSLTKLANRLRSCCPTLPLRCTAALTNLTLHVVYLVSRLATPSYSCILADALPLLLLLLSLLLLLKSRLPLLLSYCRCCCCCYLRYHRCRYVTAAALCVYPS
jgi:hypothetical protein